MTLAIITVGTSFQEALCWNLDSVWEGDFKDPIKDPDTPPTDPDIREYRHQMAKAVSWVIENQPAPAGHLQNHFKPIQTRQQYWRYPAEIDTLLKLQHCREDIFGSIDRILLVHSDDGDGRLARDLVEFIIKTLWPDRFTFHSPPLCYAALPRTQQTYDYSQILKGISRQMGCYDEALLILTGGYKLLSIISAFSFNELDHSERKYRIAYKHEDGALIIHNGMDSSLSVYVGL